MSCASQTFCVAVDGLNVITYHGTGWSAPAPLAGPTPTSTAGAYAVSCSSGAFCTAVGIGHAWTYDGSHWGSPTDIDGTQNTLTSISCLSASSCAAVDNHDDTMNYDGTEWTTRALRDPGNRIAAISCASTTFCLAVDQQGTAFAGSLPTT